MIVCKSPREIEQMRRANGLVAEVLAELAGMVEPGVTTADLDAAAERLVLAAGAEPAFKGYRGYPATLCASINDEVVHGIPANRALVGGDIISLDMGVKLDGFYGDSAVTVPVGQVSDDVQRLLRVTQEALQKGISQVRLGGRVSDIGHAIQEHVEAAGFSVVREFVGHGIGAQLHEEPQIANYGEPGRGPRLAEGMVLAIEPMVNMGRPAVKVLRDGWTAVTRDGSLSAHFEHTVAVTKDGPLVLTERTGATAGSNGSGVRLLRSGIRLQADDARPETRARTLGQCRSAWKVRCSKRCRTGFTGSRSTGSVRSSRTRQRGRAGISSGCSSAIACGWNCRRAT